MGVPCPLERPYTATPTTTTPSPPCITYPPGHPLTSGRPLHYEASLTHRGIPYPSGRPLGRPLLAGESLTCRGVPNLPGIPYPPGVPYPPGCPLAARTPSHVLPNVAHGECIVPNLFARYQRVRFHLNKLRLLQETNLIFILVLFSGITFNITRLIDCDFLII